MLEVLTPQSLSLVALPLTLTAAVLLGASNTLVATLRAGQTRLTIALRSARDAPLGTVAALANVCTAIETALHCAILALVLYALLSRDWRFPAASAQG